MSHRMLQALVRVKVRVRPAQSAGSEHRNHSLEQKTQKAHPPPWHDASFLILMHPISNFDMYADILFWAYSIPCYDSTSYNRTARLPRSRITADTSTISTDL